MHWEPCEVCGGDIIIFDLKKTNSGYRCKEDCSSIPIITAHHVPLTFNEHIQETAVPAGAPKENNPFFKNALQEEFGFDKPEDGSERRFVFTAAKQGEKPPWQSQPVTVPWVKFRFWWVVHNAFAHPLIAVAPRRTFFRFHDYTSRKMHGK